MFALGFNNVLNNIPPHTTMQKCQCISAQNFTSLTAMSAYNNITNSEKIISCDQSSTICATPLYNPFFFNFHYVINFNQGVLSPYLLGLSSPGPTHSLFPFRCENDLSSSSATFLFTPPLTETDPVFAPNLHLWSHINLSRFLHIGCW